MAVDVKRDIKGIIIMLFAFYDTTQVLLLKLAGIRLVMLSSSSQETNTTYL